jgi:hypothetical protein
MIDRRDDEMLQELRMMMLRLDPVPAEAVAAAKAEIMWRTIDAELAELTADSLIGDERLVGVRAHDAPVMLTFEVGSRVLEVEVVRSGHLRRLVGQLVPAAPGLLDIRHGGVDTAVEADEVGRFSVDGITPGPVRIRWQALPTGGRAAETDWFLA